MDIAATRRCTRQRRPIRRAGHSVAALAGEAIVVGGCSHGSPGPGVASAGSAPASGWNQRLGYGPPVSRKRKGREVDRG
jgi:hypothetical protein